MKDVDLYFKVRKLASEMLVLDDKALAAAMRNGTITKIECHE
jgi:hypothetical protein